MAAITAVIAMGLLPVLVGVLAPKDLGLGERLMVWLGGVAVIFTALFLFLRAKVWKKS
jgi:hypothetical protein